MSSCGRGVSSHAMPSPTVNLCLLSRLSKYVFSGFSNYAIPRPMVNACIISRLSKFFQVGGALKPFHAKSQGGVLKLGHAKSSSQGLPNV